MSSKKTTPKAAPKKAAPVKKIAAPAVDNITTQSAGEEPVSPNPASIITEETPTENTPPTIETVQEEPATTSDAPADQVNESPMEDQHSDGSAGAGLPASSEEYSKAEEVFNTWEMGEEKVEELYHMMHRLAKNYPEEKRFIVTSDLQVFLEKNKGDAVRHQKSLNKHEVMVLPASN